MESKKSIWSSMAGGLSSAFPLLFACCKGGACVGVCVTPVASLFGVSAATLAASPVIALLEPLFIALSAVSFTVSYYTLYAIPRKLSCSSGNTCNCATSPAENRRIKISKIVFWLGLVLSIGFISYFEYSKFQANEVASCSAGTCTPSEQTAASCSDASACSPGEECTGDAESACCGDQDSTGN